MRRRFRRANRRGRIKNIGGGLRFVDPRGRRQRRLPRQAVKDVCQDTEKGRADILAQGRRVLRAAGGARKLRCGLLRKGFKKAAYLRAENHKKPVGVGEHGRGNLAARHGQNRKFRGAQSAGERARQALQQHRRHIRHVHRRAARQGIEKAFRPQRRLGHDSLLRIPKREGDSRDFQVPAFEARAQSGGVRLARPHRLRQRHKRP